MRFATPLVPFALALSVSASAAAQGQLRILDLSESGQVARTSILAPGVPGEPWSVRLELLDAAGWDLLDFELRAAVPGARLRFVVPDAAEGLQPHTSVGVGSDGVFAWSAVEAASMSPGGELTFELSVPRERFLLRLDGGARSAATTEAAYYDLGQYVAYFSQIVGHPDLQVTQIGTTVQGRPLHRLMIDVPSSAPKKTVLMAVRQHGDEFGSSYLLEGALDLLLAQNGLTPEPELLERVRWVIYPLCNPDGANANVRYNANGIDLNRDWDRNGASALTQQPETFALQSDVEALQAQFGFHVGGDHHGWNSTPDGGFRYAQGQSVSFVSQPEYEEARKDTEIITLYDPSQSNWSENGGTAGMLRAEMYLRFGFLLHTPEYNSFVTTETEFRLKGQAWLRAMLDTLYAPRFTDGDGVPKSFVVPSLDAVYVTVDDDDENTLVGQVESVSVTLSDALTGDTETLTLFELGTNSRSFRNGTALVVVRAAAVPENGILETAPGSSLTAVYTDDDYRPDTSSATIPVLDDEFYRRARPTVPK